MKVCNTEAMKTIKEYEEQKRILLMHETDSYTVMYKEGETAVNGDYDYAKTRKEIQKLDDKIRHIRAQLAKANCSVIVDGFGVTIGEALVMLAQLQSERERTEFLASQKKISRRITQNGVLEYTECLYDPEKAKADSQALRKKISDLQMAIDRTNLNNIIEI